MFKAEKSVNSQQPYFIPSDIIRQLNDLITAIPDAKIKQGLISILNKQDYNMLLRNAVHHQQVELTKFLVNTVPSVNVNSCGPSSGQTALHIACANGNLAIVKFLVENDAFVNAMDKQSLCPVIIAEQNYHFEIMSYLLSQGGMRYMTSHEANLSLSSQKFSTKDKQLIEEVQGKLILADDQLLARKSIQDTFICAYIFRDQLATLKQLSCNKSSSSLNSIQLPLMQFLVKHNIPLLTRDFILNLNKVYKDLPLDAMTNLLDKELINDRSVILPFDVDTYQNAQQLVEMMNQLPEKFSEAFKLKIFTNQAAIQIDASPLLRWELIINTDVIPKKDANNFAKILQSVVSSEKNIMTFRFGKINKNIVDAFREFLSVQLGEKLDTTVDQPKKLL